MSHLSATPTSHSPGFLGSMQTPPLALGPGPTGQAPAHHTREEGAHLRDHVLAGHEQGPQQVLAAVVPQGMDGHLGERPQRGAGARAALEGPAEEPPGRGLREGLGQAQAGGQLGVRDLWGRATQTASSLPSSLGRGLHVVPHPQGSGKSQGQPEPHPSRASSRREMLSSQWCVMRPWASPEWAVPL